MKQSIVDSNIQESESLINWYLQFKDSYDAMIEEINRRHAVFNVERQMVERMNAALEEYWKSFFFLTWFDLICFYFVYVVFELTNKH